SDQAEGGACVRTTASPASTRPTPSPEILSHPPQRRSCFLRLRLAVFSAFLRSIEGGVYVSHAQRRLRRLGTAPSLCRRAVERGVAQAAQHAGDELVTRGVWMVAVGEEMLVEQVVQ